MSLQTDAASCKVLSKQMSFHQGNINEEFEGGKEFHSSPPAPRSCVVPLRLYRDLQSVTADVTPALKQESPADPYNNRPFCRCPVPSISQRPSYAGREISAIELSLNRAWVFPWYSLVPVQLGLWELAGNRGAIRVFFINKDPTVWNRMFLIFKKPS